MYYLNEISALRKEFYDAYDKNKFVDAVEKGERIVELYKKNNDTESIDYARDVYNAAVVCEYLMLYDKALSYYKDAAAIFEKAGKTEDEEYADTINNMAVCLGDLSRQAEALSLHKKTLAIREKLFGRNDISCIESLLNIGNTYDDMGRLDNALEYLLKALSRADRQKDLPKLEYSDILCSIARVQTGRGNYIKAIGSYSKAIDIIEKEIGDSPYSIRVLDDAAKVCFNAEKYDMAIIYYNKSLEIREMIVENNSVEFVAELNFLAVCYAKNGDTEKAVEIFDKALKKVTGIVDANHQFYSDIIMNKAYAYYANKDYKTACETLEMAYNLKKNSEGEGSIELMKVLSKMVSAYIKAGDYCRAEESCARCLVISTSSGNNVKIARAYRNYAKLAIAREDYCSAQEHLLKAEKLFENEPEDKRKFYNHRIVPLLSDVLALNGDYDGAEKYAGRMTAFAAVEYGTEHPKYAYCLYKLAEKMILNNQFAAGINNLEKAISICRETMGTLNGEYKNAEEVLDAARCTAALYYLEMGDFDSALSNYEKAKVSLENDERTVDFAGVFISKDDLISAKSIVEKYRESEKSGFFEDWINLKEKGVITERLESYKGVFSGFLCYDLAEKSEGDKAKEYYKKAVDGVTDEKYIKAVSEAFPEDEEMLEKTLSYAEGKKLDKTEEYYKLLKTLCELYFKNGNYEKALDGYEKLVVLISDDDDKTVIYIDSLIKMGRICSALKYSDDAAEYFSEASLVIKKRFGEGEAFEACLKETGELYLELGKTESAVAVFEKAMNVSEKLYGKNDEKHILNILKLADACFKSDKEKSIGLYEKVYNICAENRCVDKLYKACLERLTEYFKTNKKYEKVLKIKLGKMI